jgi:GTP-binding protein
MDPIEDWAMINQELALYDAHLESKPQLVVLNKIDLPDGRAWTSLVAEVVEAAGYPFLTISAITGEGVRQMLYRAVKMVDETPFSASDETETVVIGPPEDDTFRILKLEDGWRVKGRNIERVAAMTYWEFEATTRRFQQILEKAGISQALVDAGISPGDTVYIGDETLEWSE